MVKSNFLNAQAILRKNLPAEKAEAIIKIANAIINSSYELDYLNIDKENLEGEAYNYNFLPDTLGLLNFQRIDIMQNETIINLPRSIEGWKNLTALSLETPNIVIPASMGQLKDLTFLRINLNQDIPDFIRNFKKLKILHILSNNNRLNIQPILSLKNLKELRFENVIFDRLPKELFSLTGLTKLTFSNCIIPEVPEEISRLKNLEILAITKSTLARLPDSIASLKNLKEFSVLSSTLKKEEVDRIKKLLPPNVKIYH